MKIDSIQVGPIMTNCYLLCDDAAGVCCVIDPGDEPARVEQMVQRSGCELRTTARASPGCSSGTRSCRSISVKRT